MYIKIAIPFGITYRGKSSLSRRESVVLLDFAFCDVLVRTVYQILNRLACLKPDKDVTPQMLIVFLEETEMIQVF